MSDTEPEKQAEILVFEYELDAPPEKVWRAISVPGFRDKWLPEEDLADADPVSTAPGEEIRYAIRDGEPPFLESVVTFQVRPGADGGSVLRVVHGLTDARLVPRKVPAANNNGPRMMLAA
jgi:uncharacterized protein YndB with AHSA1/START domain